ncbi:toxin-antitoxin system YwqK family antitoxin [Pseudomonas sp. 09C 129]|uniref:toxin-antitoxin system YwqK family antitoxin n=1 Tax=Pseudomonas sp. 09C 129 TaxID=2054915 RepID=UPI0012FF2DD5|nr:hypothetical protein [Pseudomonas sp. 09C 129]
MLRVPINELSYRQDGLYYFNNEPFTGVAVEMLENGHIKTEIEHRNGLQWGGAKEWYGPDRPMVESNFFEGVLHGRAREWHENGQIAEDGEYEYGITIWKKHWDENGVLVKEYSIDESDPRFQRVLQRRIIYGRS